MWLPRALTLAALAFGLAACAASRSEVQRARDVGYDTEFATVYSTVLELIRKDYPYLQEDASAGVIKTSWHPVRNLSAEDDPHQSDRPINMTDPIEATTGSRVRKLYFIRFQAYVSGGSPWRVRIDGQASEWSAAGVPQPLYGANVPPWLEGRVNALRVKVYRRLKKHAVKLASTDTASMPPAPEPVVEVDQSQLGGLPPDALVAVIDVLGAAKARDFDALARFIHPDFEWSPGAPPSARQALIMWRADSSIVDRLVQVLESGCAVEADGSRVVCPAGAETGYRAVFQKTPEGAWHMVSFMSTE